MTNFNASIILILTLFYVVQLKGIETHNTVELTQITNSGAVDTEENNNDVIQLNNFFEKLQENQEYFSKKVILDDQEVSIRDHFLSTNKNSKNDLWPVTTENVNELLHLINIVISCEYSEITYNYIKLIDADFGSCIKDLKDDNSWFGQNKINILNTFFEKYRTNLLDNYLEQIPLMIFSLANLVTVTKNVVFKYHDILRILLSWYAYLFQNGKTIRNTNEHYSVRMSRLESIAITNFQVKNRLERYIVKHCYRLVVLPEFFKQEHTKISALNNDINYKTFFKINFDKIKLLTYPNFESIQNKYVINSSESNAQELITLLTNEVSSKEIKIRWGNSQKDMKKVYNSDIKNNIDIRTILQYEKILQNVIIEIIVEYEMKILKTILNDNNNINQSNECNKLLKEISDFVEKLDEDDQPIGLINDLLRIIKDLSSLCLIMTDCENKASLHDIVNNLNKSVIPRNISKFTGSTGIKFFLQSLSKMTICVKLHPLISNTFWKQLSIYSVPEYEHLAVSYQNLHTMYQKIVNNDLCNRTVDVQKQIINIKEQLENCIGNNAKNNLELTNNSCFTEFNTEYDKVIINIANIAANTFPEYFNNWAKMLLILYFNRKNVSLFDSRTQNSLKTIHIQHLITFLYTMINLLSENQYVECSCGVLSLNDIGRCNKHISKYWKENIQDFKNMPEIRGLDGVYKYEEEIRKISNSVKSVLTVFKNVNIEFKLFWDGTKKELHEVHTSYQMNTFDIPDAYDYVSFNIKWVISIVYSRLMDILDFMITYQLEVDEKELMTLNTNLKNFLKIDLPNTKSTKSTLSIKLLLVDFIYALKSLDRNDTEKNIRIKNDMEVKFEFLGFVKESPPKRDGTISDLNSVFTDEVRQLMLAYFLKVDQ